MVNVRGDVLRPPHGTTPAAVKAHKNQKLVPLRAMKTFIERRWVILRTSPKDRSPESNMHRRSNMVFSVIKAGHYKVNSPNNQILNACEILCLLKTM